MNRFFNKNFSFALNKELNEFLFVSVLLVLVPAFLPNQFISGAIVNAILIRSALAYDLRKVFFLAFLPSSFVFLTGVIFGSTSQALAFILPSIFVGNLLLMFLIKKLFVEKKLNYWLASIISVSTKTLLLGASAFILFNLGLVPIAFLTIFGINQLITGISGAIIYFAYKNAFKK